MKFTRREKQALIAALIIAIILLIVRPSYETIQDWEWLFLFVVVGPLGIYIALDPERRKEG